jgi:hypothetical protein
MTYEIGLSSGTLEALKSVGGFSMDKIQQFWPMMLNQQAFEGWWLICLPLVAIIVCVACDLTRRHLSSKNEYRWNDHCEALGVFVIISGILAVIGLTTSLPLGVSKLINPEYYAVMDILSKLK